MVIIPLPIEIRLTIYKHKYVVKYYFVVYRILKFSLYNLYLSISLRDIYP